MKEGYGSIEGEGVVVGWEGGGMVIGHGVVRLWVAEWVTHTSGGLVRHGGEVGAGWGRCHFYCDTVKGGELDGRYLFCCCASVCVAPDTGFSCV